MLYIRVPKRRNAVHNHRLCISVRAFDRLPGVILYGAEVSKLHRNWRLEQSLDLSELKCPGKHKRYCCCMLFCFCLCKGTACPTIASLCNTQTPQGHHPAPFSRYNCSLDSCSGLWHALQSVIDRYWSICSGNCRWLHSWLEQPPASSSHSGASFRTAAPKLTGFRTKWRSSTRMRIARPGSLTASQRMLHPSRCVMLTHINWF